MWDSARPWACANARHGGVGLGRFNGHWGVRSPQTSSAAPSRQGRSGRAGLCDGAAGGPAPARSGEVRTAAMSARAAFLLLPIQAFHARQASSPLMHADSGSSDSAITDVRSMAPHRKSGLAGGFQQLARELCERGTRNRTGPRGGCALACSSFPSGCDEKAKQSDLASALGIGLETRRRCRSSAASPSPLSRPSRSLWPIPAAARWEMDRLRQAA